MLKDREINKIIKEINIIVKYIIILHILVITCLIICLIESIWNLSKNGGFYGKRKKNKLVRPIC